MECPICFENKDDFYHCDICQEDICQDCKKAWEKDCPYCRSKYTPPRPKPCITIPEPTRPLLMDYLHSPVVERRWETRQIIGCALVGGLITWFVLQ